MKHFLTILLAAVISAAVCTAAAQNAKYSDKISVNSLLATIDGEPVTLMDVVMESGPAERELAGLYTGERLTSETEKLRRSVLEKIIDRKLVYKEYQNDPFIITRQMVETALDHYAKSFGGRKALEDRLASEGVTMASLKKQIRESIAVDIILIRNCDRLIDVTPKEVYDEYMRNTAGFTKPATIDFQLLQINRENRPAGQDAAAVAEKLAPTAKQANEALFSRLVAEYSDGTGKESGGHVNDMELGRLRPAFQKALKDLAAGEVAGPVETPEAYFFLRVLRVGKAERIPFEKVSGEIHESLRQERIKQKRTEFRKRLREKAMIRYYI